MAPKVSTFSGLLSGIAAGYIFSQQALIENMARARREKALINRMDRESAGGIYNMSRGESAMGAGLQSLDDKYATVSCLFPWSVDFWLIRELTRRVENIETKYTCITCINM